MHSHESKPEIDDLLTLLAESGDTGYIGESISQLEHALQAAYFAQKAGASEELIAAALLHDVGHLCASKDAPQMDGLGVLNHEDIGAEYLKKIGFPADVAALVRGHVQAKRYLVYKTPGYFSKVSEASKGTLNFQGGPMNEAEATLFEKETLFKAKLAVRQFDERAKEPDLKVPSLESYRPLFYKLVSARA